MVGRKRRSVSGLSARRFGERQKRWGKSFQRFFSLSPAHSSGNAESLLFRQNYCNPSFVLPLPRSKLSAKVSPSLPLCHPPPLLHSSKATTEAWTRQRRRGLKAESAPVLRGCFSQSALLYEATLWKLKEAWLRHTRAQGGRQQDILN